MTEKEKRIQYIHENNWESVKEDIFFGNTNLILQNGGRSSI